MPHEFLNKSISRILFISASCTAIILLLWLHPLCHLSPSVPFTGQHQIFIASLFFNKLSTPIPQPFPPLTPFRLFPFTSEKGPFFLVISLLHPFKLFPFCNTLISSRILPLLCIVTLLVSFFPALCPVFLSLSRLCPEPSSSSSALHAEILGERRESGRQRWRACGWARGYWRRRWGQY